MIGNIFHEKVPRTSRHESRFVSLKVFYKATIPESEIQTLDSEVQQSNF